MCEKSLPIFTTGFVTGNYRSGDADPSFLLDIWIDGSTLEDLLLIPGQFFMLRKKGSSFPLARPISLYHASYDHLEFMIMEKGGGTSELAGLKEDDAVEVLGPLGNGFPEPSSADKICLIGGGIGAAPISNLAFSLPRESYAYYACFKDNFGADLVYNVPDERLVIATEDGSCGVKGMLPKILTADTLKAEGYTVVYACGPTPMLKYVQTICKEAGVKSYFSMENRMACGVGACLGCTIRTTEGNKRVCKDGPVFSGEILIFEEPSLRVLEDDPLPFAPDLSVRIAGIHFKNPIIAASGTFGYGVEYEHLVDPSLLGGICSKGLTLEPRTGNSGVRIHEIPRGGLMNSIGLENPGIEHFIEHELPTMLSFDTVTIANLSGSTLDTYVEGAKLLDKTCVDMVELNISCPNVKAGGMSFGMTPETAGAITSAIKDVTRKPLIVKLTPNAPDLVGVALAVHEAGADAISLVNTFQALAIDIDTGKPVFNNVCAGYSGSGIKPIALRMVHDVAKALHRFDKHFPIIGLGGITTWQDAVEFIMAGATAVEVGTATFANPRAMLEIIDGLREFMSRKGFGTVSSFRGIAL